MLRAALASAQHIGPVFPLKPSDKPPLTAHGVKDATRDEQTIAAWWRRWPNANLGLAAGFGFIVVDVDPRNGGDDGLRELESRIGMLPRTWTSSTGGGGWHYLYAAPVGSRVRASLAPGVDCKGAGGYIVAPPSIHPSGKRYAWHPELHPLKLALTPAPDALLQYAVERQRRDVGPAVGPAAVSFLARAFDVAGWLGCDLPNGAVAVRCPWFDEHSDGRGDGVDSSSVILPPTPQRPIGTFRCSHSHCLRRGNVAALYALPEQALAIASGDDRAGFMVALSLIRSAA